MVDNEILDRPVFKRLSANDTAGSVGHQGGLVIPKDIAPYFPPLDANNDPANPTSEATIRAELFVDGFKVGDVETRYQHQTWGGTRSPEHRLTSNLGNLRKLASAEDFVLFQRFLDDPARMRISLIRQGTPEFVRIANFAGPARWGVLDRDDPPVSLQEISKAKAELDSIPPNIFADDRRTIESRTTRLARHKAFRDRVLGLYGNRCAFSGKQLMTPAGLTGLDAAHIIPVTSKGSDHPVNGVALAKDIHWAFDKGLIGVDADRRIIVPGSVTALTENAEISRFAGRSIAESHDTSMLASEEGFAWHRQFTLEK